LTCTRQPPTGHIRCDEDVTCMVDESVYDVAVLDLAHLNEG
jgi:hypothetical protein